MTTWAVLPVKPFTQGKSRLHPYLEREEVYQLNRDLFRSTYQRLEACNGIDKILIITKDDEILKMVAEWGGIGLQESTPSSLNLAISQAFDFIQDSGDSGPVLIIPADLPRMRTEDLSGLIALAMNDSSLSDIAVEQDQENLKKDQFLVIVPDYNQTGTNALFMSSPALIKAMFGPRSFQKHIRQGLIKAKSLSVWLNEALQYDLDTLQDLEKYNKINQYSNKTIN